MNSNYFIPTVVVDDFFEDPDSVREMALNLDYPETNKKYPGKRTKPLHEIDSTFNQNFINRAMGVFYNTRNEKPYSWFAKASFQLIDEKYIDGWVHRDNEVKITIIVYLNKNPNEQSGTSIYRAKDSVGQINDDFKQKFMDGKITADEAESYRKQNNDQFEEIINIKNSYNRMIAFDGNRYHAANSFGGNDEERLTLVCFIYDLHVMEYPIYRMKTQ